MKSTLLNLRVSTEEKDIIKAKAKELNMTNSQFIRHAIRTHQTISLSCGKEILSKLQELHNDIRDKTLMSFKEQMEAERKIKSIMDKAQKNSDSKTKASIDKEE